MALEKALKCDLQQLIRSCSTLVGPQKSRERGKATSGSIRGRVFAFGTLEKQTKNQDQGSI